MNCKLCGNLMPEGTSSMCRKHLTRHPTDAEEYGPSQPSTVRRYDDMSTDNYLQVFQSPIDGDIHIMVYNKRTSSKGFSASVEFCTSGGHSYNTMVALINLVEAMKKDGNQFLRKS